MPIQRCVACARHLVPSGKTMHCSCGGAWVAESTLVAMARELHGPLVRLPWRPRSGATRACPMCRTAMQIVSLEGVVLDRCPPHGIWFDAYELGAVLDRIKFAIARRITPVKGSRTGLPPALNHRQQATLLARLFDLSDQGDAPRPR